MRRMRHWSEVVRSAPRARAYSGVGNYVTYQVRTNLGDSSAEANQYGWTLVVGGSFLAGVLTTLVALGLEKKR